MEKHDISRNLYPPNCLMSHIGSVASLCFSHLRYTYLGHSGRKLGTKTSFDYHICLSVHASIFVSIYISLSLSSYLILPLSISHFLSRSLFQSLYLSSYLSIYLSVCPSLSPCVCPSVCLSTFLSLSLSRYLSSLPSVHPSCRSLGLSATPPIYLSTSLSLSLSLSRCIWLTVCLSLSLYVSSSFHLRAHLPSERTRPSNLCLLPSLAISCHLLPSCQPSPNPVPAACVFQSLLHPPAHTKQAWSKQALHVDFQNELEKVLWATAIFPTFCLPFIPSPMKRKMASRTTAFGTAFHLHVSLDLWHLFSWTTCNCP